jgi:hypothetical protein
MTAEQHKPHSAAHTLKFIENDYAEKDDDAAHYTWNDILNAVRTPRTTLFAWIDSFTLRTLCYSEIIERISGVRLTKINKIIAKQITDEKLTISTLNSAYSSITIQESAYEFNDLVKLLRCGCAGLVLGLRLFVSLPPFPLLDDCMKSGAAPCFLARVRRYLLIRG